MPTTNTQDGQLVIDGTTCDVTRDQLRLLVERDNPTAWIASALLAATEDETSQAESSPVVSSAGAD